MSGSSEVLQEYLVKLGFRVDQGDLKKFNDAFEVVGKRVFGVGLAVAGVVASVEQAAAAFAYNMRKVYYDSQLAGSSVKNLQSLEYAGKQVGVSADSMASAVHSMAQALRLNPGLQGFIEQFGIKVQGRDVSDVMTDYIKALDKMPEFQGAQFAGMFGMDPDTYHLLRGHIDELLQKQREMKAAQEALGIDMDKAAAQSKHYADTIDNLKMHFEALTTVILSKAAPAFDKVTSMLTKDMDDTAKNIQKKGVLAAWGDNILTGLSAPFRAEAAGWDWLKHWVTGTPTTPGARSTGVLPIPGAPALAVGPGKGLAGPNAAALAALEAKYPNLPSGILSRVYQIESASGANPGRSNASALGPFQFMQGTGQDYGLSTDADRMDFGKSSNAAARYLSKLLAKYGGNVDMALAAYNWGPGNVDKYGIGNLNPETQGYLGKYHALESGNAVTIQNTFHISGSNAKEIADRVAGVQSRTYGDALRNTQGATR